VWIPIMPGHTAIESALDEVAETEIDGSTTCRKTQT
jgi:hypothetical protein